MPEDRADPTRKGETDRTRVEAGEGDPHHVWRGWRIVVVIVLILLVALIVVFAFEPFLRLAMFLGFVAPHLPAQ